MTREVKHFQHSVSSSPIQLKSLSDNSQNQFLSILRINIQFLEVGLRLWSRKNTILIGIVAELDLVQRQGENIHSDTPYRCIHTGEG